MARLPRFGKLGIMGDGQTGMSVSETASRIGKSTDAIQQVVQGRKGVDADMALRFSKLFSTSPELWLNGQMAWDMWHIMYGENSAEIDVIEPITS